MLSDSTTTNDNFVAKLVDFGLAEKLNSKGHNSGSESNAHQGAGTKGYTAPEIIAGEQTVGTASDIWSLGCLLHAMLTVTLPYHADMSNEEA